MIHTKIDGTNNHVIIMLHGTGGDELSLAQIARYLDPNATLIGVRGNIEENEMLRFFERYQDGSFDLKSLMQETKKLYTGIEKALVDYELQDDDVSLLGYSNGSNIAINLLKEYETNYKNAWLFHPSSVRPEVPFKAQKNLKLLLTSGANDPFITADAFSELVVSAEKQIARVENYTHEFGHELIQEELDIAKQLSFEREVIKQ